MYHIAADLANRASPRRTARVRALRPVAGYFAPRTWTSVCGPSANSTAWAFSLQSDAETARGWVAHYQKESGDLTERAKQLEAALQLAHDKPWRLVAKKLRSMLKGGQS